MGAREVDISICLFLGAVPMPWQRRCAMRQPQVPPSRMPCPSNHAHHHPPARHSTYSNPFRTPPHTCPTHPPPHLLTASSMSWVTH